MGSNKIDYIRKHHLSYIFYRLKGKGYTYKEVSDIVESYQLQLADDISAGQTVKFKNGLGSLLLTKIKRGVAIADDGSMINTMPIDIVKTSKLWKEHPELKDKTYVRFINEHTNGYLFCLTYRVKTSTLKLKSYYTFRKNRGLKTKLAQNIKAGKVDAIIKKSF